MAVMEATDELVRTVQANASAPGLAIILSCDYKQPTPRPVALKETEGDGIRMEATMKSLGYAVMRIHNVTRAQLMSVVCGAAEKVPYPRSFRRLMFVFSGHGNDQSLVTNDGEKISVSDIVKELSPKPRLLAHSPLKDMVRLFIIDACRGHMDDVGITVPKGGTSVNAIRIPSYQGNLLIAYSAVQDFRSYEEHGSGGLWLSLVAEELKADCDIQCVFTRVNMKLRQKLQHPKYEYVQQPETISRLNELVNLAREAPGSREVSLSLANGHGWKLPSSSSPQPDKPICMDKPIGTLHRHGIQLQHQESLPVPSSEKSAIVPSLQRQVTYPPDAKESPPVAVLSCHNVTGEYKSKLNELKQKGLISDFSWLDDRKHDINGRSGFRTTLKVKFPNGGSYLFTSQHYFSTKQASQEDAAKMAIDAINKQQTLYPSLLVGKRDLNNLMVQKYHSEVPTYETTKVNEGFRCTVSHPLFTRTNGRVGDITYVGSSSKEAENGAAGIALNLLKDHKL